MAKILVSCAAADGHVHPFIQVISHLIKCGHKVVWICGLAYQERIEATGARFVPFPSSFDPKGMPIYDFKPELKKLKGIAQIKFYVKTWCYDMALPTMAILKNIRKSFEPDLYISDPMIYAPYFEAEILGKPSINLHVIPLTVSSKDHGPFGTGIGPPNSFFGKLRIQLLYRIGDLIFRDLKKHCDAIRSGLGLQPYHHIFDGFLQNATTVFTTTVAGFDYPRSDMPENIKYLGPILPKAKSDFEVPDWWDELKEENPVILVNQGTIANDITELILPAIQAFKNESVLVVAVPVNEAIPDLPKNVKVAKFIPFANILPYVDVMVTNGGFGATHMALAHGIPMVSSGGSEDKMEVAARVAYSGCGINLKKIRPSPSEIKSAVFQVLQNSTYEENASRLKQEIEGYHPLELFAQTVTELS